MHTCPNPSCGKAFTKPLKALNLQQNPTEPYNACPYCLTKLIEEPIIIENDAPETSFSESTTAAKRKSPEKEKSASCNYHMGYLSERTDKGQIPDDCLVCKAIVDCMLHKMHE